VSEAMQIRHRYKARICVSTSGRRPPRQAIFA
jgi:hypothetical protein